jgi:glycosyltransferase involved in cell wall biosynthesis
MSLRILWSSDKIIGTSAYSRVTYEVCTRLAKMGYAVAHVPMGRANRMGKWSYQGVLVYPSGQDPFNEDVILDHYIDWKADLLITLKEPWCFQSSHRWAYNFCPHAIIDHSPVSPAITSRLHTAFRVIVVSRFAQKELAQAGFAENVRYIPHGVDTQTFRPLENRAECKKLWFIKDPDDFTVLFVGKNQSRKMIPHVLKAYKLFRERNPDVKSHMLLWTDVNPISREQYEGAVALGVADVGVNLLPEIMNLGLGEVVLWPDAKLVREGLPDWAGPQGHDMVKLYNAADVVISLSGEGFWCLPPDTKIITLGGPKRIKDVRKGDFALTHKGRFRKVTGTYKRWVNEKLVKITPWGLNIPIELTENHQVLAFKRPPKKHLGRLWSCQTPEWIPAGELASGDCVLFPIPQQVHNPSQYDLAEFDDNLEISEDAVSYKMGYSPRTKEKVTYKRFIKHDHNLAQLFGWYIAEGSTTKESSYVAFSLNKNDPYEKIISLMEQTFGVGFPTIVRGEEKIELFFSGRLLARFFSKKCGVGAHAKKIPEEFLYGDLSLLKSLLDEYCKGDGCWRGTRVRLFTASEQLAYGLVQAFLRLGKKPCIRYSERKTGHKGYEIEASSIEGVTHSNKSWRLNDGKYVAFLIHNVEKKDYEGYVYNVKVDEDNSYCTSSFAVHNCPGLEAEACGVPIICADYAAAPEICGAGLTVPVQDYVVLNTPGTRYPICSLDRAADALTRIMNADRGKLARKARAFAERFDWNVVMERYFKPFLEECEVELKPLVTSAGVKPWD